MSHQLFAGEDHTAKYRVYRPTYPKELFEQIRNYYFDGKDTNEKIPLALDVGCGSGQATVDLSQYCERVIGTDVSENQIANAIPKDNVEYRCNKGEDLSFLPSNSVDLITVATALHWLDVEAFVKEVQRVLKPKTGVFAVWTYAYGTLDNPAANAITHDFYFVQLLPYWNEKQHLVNDYYQSLVPLFPYQSTLRRSIIERQNEITLGVLMGFIETASACQAYKRQNNEQVYQETLTTLRKKLAQCYLQTETCDNIDSIKIASSSPIYLYLMKKIEI